MVIGGDTTKIEIRGNAGISRAKSLLNRGFGVERGGKIVLHPVEVAYLACNPSYSVYEGGKKLELEDVFRWCFSNRENVLLFFVYRDLRDRGRRVRIQGNRIVEKKVYLPVSERDILRFSEFSLKSGLKPDILAVVDEEGDVTYYRLWKWDETGEQEGEPEPFTGVFAGDRVVTNCMHVFERFFYGSMSKGLVTLSLVEAVYLSERGILSLDVSGEELLREAKRVEENFEERYRVYRDLKSRKFVVKTGFKFGSDFRVYDRVESVRDLPHSKYLIKVAEEMRASEMASHARVASTVRKKMVFCYFNSEGEPEYICFERVKV